MKKENDIKTIQKYKELIKEGKFEFVIKKGIFYFGGFMFLFNYLINYGFVWNTEGIIVNLIVWGLAGLVSGLILWWWINRKLKSK